MSQYNASGGCFRARLRENRSELIQTGLKSQAALKGRSVYMTISLQPIVRSQITFKNFSVRRLYCTCANDAIN